MTIVILEKTDGDPSRFFDVNGALQVLCEAATAPRPTGNEHPGWQPNVATRSGSSSMKINTLSVPPCVEGAVGRSNRFPIVLHNHKFESAGNKSHATAPLSLPGVVCCQDRGYQGRVSLSGSLNVYPLCSPDAPLQSKYRKKCVQD